MLYFNIWIMIGLVNFLYLIFVGKVHEEDMHPIPDDKKVLALFVTSIILGGVGVVIVLIDEIRYIFSNKN